MSGPNLDDYRNSDGSLSHDPLYKLGGDLAVAGQQLPDHTPTLSSREREIIQNGWFDGQGR